MNSTHIMTGYDWIILLGFVLAVLILIALDGIFKKLQTIIWQNEKKLKYSHNIERLLQIINRNTGKDFEL